MGDRPEKHKCLNCDGNHTSTEKSCSERKRIINRKKQEQINGIEKETIEAEVIATLETKKQTCKNLI